MNNYKEKSKNTFNKQAQVYDSTYYSSHARKNYVHILKEIEKEPCQSILEVGCGTG